jgi:hypothetical protein
MDIDTKGIKLRIFLVGIAIGLILGVVITGALL